MTEIRCPMCGKTNPYHLDVCKFCQARLRPLIASSDSSPTPKSGDEPKPKPESGLPDWMSSMRGDAADDFGGEDDAFDDGSDDDAMDWLNRIQDEPVSRIDRQEPESVSPFEEEPESPEEFLDNMDLPTEIVDLSKLNLEELRLECDRRGIKYHHRHKEETLRKLLA